VYSSSKKAAEVMFDILRLELAPFGVKVTTVVTTTVVSMGQVGVEDKWNLSKDSMYAEIRETYDKRKTGNDGIARMDTHKYAEGVVDKLLKGNSAKFWYGANSGMTFHELNMIHRLMHICTF
jgi:1-acylglycerone phosphate reductase